MRRGAPRHFLNPSLTLGAIGLFALLAVLAFLQYRWAGELSTAELVRLRAVANARANEFARAFDREITRVFLTFVVRTGDAGVAKWQSVVRADHNWRSQSPHPRLVKSVYVLDPANQASDDLERIDGSSGAVVRGACPPELTAAVARFRRNPAAGASARNDGPLGPIDDVAPALVLPIFDLATMRADRLTPRAGPPRWPGIVLVLLDLEYIRDVFLPALRMRYFQAADGFDYQLRVSTVTDALLYSSSEDHVVAETPDASVRLFDIRLGGENQDLAEGLIATSPDVGRSPFASGDASGGRGRRFMLSVPAGGSQRELSGGWRLDLWNRAGSLPQVVTAARQRNLAISFGILGLLGTSVALLLTAARRAERLARRQVEFVAGVTHEVRTPITVILSAAENLADGLVGTGAEMRAYGALIRDDARRLRDMVEQILEFAGADGGRGQVARLEPVHLQPIIADVIKNCTRAPEGMDVDIRIDIREHLPPVLGDAVALTRVVRNLVDNAVKYAGAPCWVLVRAEASDAGGRREVVLTVEDHGLGIGAEDLPHIFEPFYRARTVVGLRIPGTGLGLSLVLRIVESHGGRITVDSAPDRGSSFVVSLPAAAIASPTSPAGTDRAPHCLH